MRRWRSQCGDTASLMTAFLAVRLTMPLTARSVRCQALRLANTVIVGAGIDAQG